MALLKMPSKAWRFLLVILLWVFPSSICCANIHGHSDCNGLRCSSLPVGIISLALGILKEKSENIFNASGGSLQRARRERLA
jgi:hypothetical protein